MVYFRRLLRAAAAVSFVLAVFASHNAFSSSSPNDCSQLVADCWTVCNSVQVNDFRSCITKTNCTLRCEGLECACDPTLTEAEALQCLATAQNKHHRDQRRCAIRYDDLDPRLEP